jgi:hypothetical protein
MRRGGTLRQSNVLLHFWQVQSADRVPGSEETTGPRHLGSGQESAEVKVPSSVGSVHRAQPHWKNLPSCSSSCRTSTDSCGAGVSRGAAGPDLRVDIAVCDLLPLPDVPAGPDDHPEALLHAGEGVGRVGHAVVVGDAGDLVETAQAVPALAAPLLRTDLGVDLKIVDEEDAEHSVDILLGELAQPDCLPAGDREG